MVTMNLKIDNDIVNLKMIKNVSKIPNEYKFPTSYIGIFFHEFSHPYCNPLCDKYFKNINIDSLIAFSISKGLQSFYTYKDSFIGECIVRAITSYFIRKYTKEEYFLMDIENNKKKGFVYIDELIKLIDKKDKYSNFEEFYKKEVVNYFIFLVKRYQNIKLYKVHYKSYLYIKYFYLQNNW